ncbi:MAG: efflux RND transporter periplasmic adaptor subunit [Pseudomonadota bacterium]
MQQDIVLSNAFSRSVIGAVMCLVALAGPPSVAYAQDDTGEAPRVVIAAAYIQEIEREASFIGRGEAVSKTDLIARVSGFLTEQVVTEGQSVSEGDTLFLIERQTYEAAVMSQEASLSRAEANLELAEIELERREELVSRGTISESEADIARANAKVAEADLQAAQAALDQAEIDLDYTTVTAPFAGRVGRSSVSLGALVGPTTGPLATLVTQSPIYVTFSLSEPQLINVLEQIDSDVEGMVTDEVSPDVFVVLPNGTRLEEPGQVVFIDNQIDPSTGTIALRAEFENESGHILDGAFVSVIIQAIEPTPSVMVPQAALQRDQRGDFVLVVTDQQLVEQRYVTLGPQIETAVVVEDGLRSGESVIVEGLQRVRPGVAVDAVLAGQSEGN